MKPLRELTFISGYRPTEGPLLTLFNLVEKGASREEALQYFLENGRSKTYFNTMLNRLKSKLLEGILFYNFNDYAEYRREVFSIYNKCNVCMKLIESGNRISGIPEAEKILRKCLHLGLTQQALNLSIHLEYHFSIISFQPDKFNDYHRLSESLQKERNLELNLHRFFTKMYFSIKKKISLDYVIGELEKYKSQLPGMHYRSNLFYYSIQILYYRQTENTENVVATCKAAVRHFKSYQTPLPFTTTWNFNRQMIPILIAEGKTGEAEIIAKQCRDLCTPGNYNWHVSLIYLALTGFHSGKPAIALQAWREAQSVQKRFDGSQEIQDRWQLIRSYLMLYSKLGKITMFEDFKMYKFLNSVTSLNRDKARNNVSVIIVELLHLWLDGKKEKFGDRAKSLSNYIHRHLDEDHQARYFLKLMEKRYEAEYNERVSAQIPELLDKVNSFKPLIDANVFETNVIPPGMAWEMISNKIQ